MTRWETFVQMHWNMEPAKNLQTLVALNRTCRFWWNPALHDFEEEYIKQKDKRDEYFEKKELERIIREKDDTFFGIDELKNLLLYYEDLDIDNSFATTRDEFWRPGDGEFRDLDCSKALFLDWFKSKKNMTYEEWKDDIDDRRAEMRRYVLL